MYNLKYYIPFLLAGTLLINLPLQSQENCKCPEAESLRAPMGYYFNSGQLDSASFYARKLLNYKNTACIIFYQGWMAQIAIAEKNTGAARLFLAEEEKLLKEKNCNQDLYVRHYSTLAKMYLELNQQDSFVIAGLKGIDAATKAKDYYGLSRANTDLASAFSSIGQTAKAIFYYRNAMAAAKQQNKVPSLVASVATRLANSYLDLYKETSTSSYADSASILGLEAMSIAEKSKDILAFLEANETMAGYSLQTGKTSEAIRYAEIIIKSSPRGVHLFDRITYAGFSKKAAALYQMKKYEESGIMADSALQYATAFNPQMMISAYENIYLASKANGDSTRGLNAYEKMVAIRDSLFSVEKNNAITELEKKYNQAKNENTIRDLSKKKQIYLLLSIAGILALLAIGFYVRQQSLKHKKVVLETEQRLNQARMNPHFFFNTLTTLQKLALQENHGEVMAGNLARFSNIMRETLESTYKEYISIEQEIDFLTQYLEVQKVHYPDAFSYEIVAAGDLETDELQIPPMIIQPFVENSIEHAFAGLQYKGEIKVAFHLLNKELLIEITDNGKGLPSPGQKNSDHISRATQIIRDRVYLLNRKLKTRAGYQITNNENKPGVLVAIHLPLIYKDQIKKSST